MSGNLKTFRLALVALFAMFAFGVSAQTVKGTVKDASGEPVIGATVQEQGTKNVAVTDLDGNFSIKLSGGQQLQFSYIGMKTQTVDAKGKSVVNVTLEDEATALDDLVVIGYGTVKKRDLTGAVTSVSAEDIGQIPVSNVSEALTGKMAGVNITTTEGSPDADIKIRVRGGGSLSQDNSPLYIVDGFPVESISDISPSEIESIDVLKDASSTAIYGSRGANGVIIVTTKSGSEGKIQVNFNGSLGWKKITKEIPVMDPYNYAYYQYELDTNSKSIPTTQSYGNYEDLDIWKSVEGHDWQDDLFGRTGTQKMYNVNVSGGSKEVKFNIGFSHSDEEAIMLGSGYSKNNVNAKLNAKLNKWLTLDFTGRLAFTKLDGLSGGADLSDSNAANSIVANAVRYRPVEPLAGDDDSENNTSTQRTPLQRINGTYKYQERFQQNYNVGLNWKPFKGWTFRTEFGYTWRYYNTDYAMNGDATMSSKLAGQGQPQVILTRDNRKQWRNANTVTYDNDKLFGGRDHINVLIGHEWSSSQENSNEQTSISFPATMTPQEALANMAAGTAMANVSDIGEEDNLLSFFGRINYTMADKYLATFTLRADGSSKFAKGNRWGWFPSAALAWRISEENFMKKAQSWLSNLKLRLSFGMAGNNRIPAGSIRSTYSLSGNSAHGPFFNDVRVPMLQKGNILYNPNLKWETTITRNIGIDYGFWNNRISGTLDFYWNTTDDLLMRSGIPTTTGYEYQYQNFGKTSNKGIEFALNAVLVDKKDFGLNFNFNIAYNRNKIEEVLMDNPWQINEFAGKTFANYETFRIEEGGRLGEIWGYMDNGFFTVYDPTTGKGDLVLNGTNWELAPGHAPDNSQTLTGGIYYPGGKKYKVDENGDPIKRRLGNTVPSTTGGFGIDGRVGNFDFNIFFNYSLGNKIVNATKIANSFFSGSSKNYNILAAFNLGKRYTWIDPETGLNIGRPSGAVVDMYGGADAIMARLNEINANAKVYNPAAVTNMYFSDGAIEDADFLRLQNITIGYTFPKKWTRAIHIENIRIYFTGYNLFCITGYDGYDPEVDTSSKNNPMTPGVDYAAYPKARTFVGGINITF